MNKKEDSKKIQLVEEKKDGIEKINKEMYKLGHGREGMTMTKASVTAHGPWGCQPTGLAQAQA